MFTQSNPKQSNKVKSMHKVTYSTDYKDKLKVGLRLDSLDNDYRRNSKNCLIF